MGTFKSLFAQDKKKESEGKWVDFSDEVSFLIARSNNEKFKKLARKKTKPYRQQIQNDNMSNVVALQISKEIYAKTILLGWKGLTDENDKEIEYSYDNALKLFMDPSAGDDFFEAIKDLAGVRELFALAEDEETAKNSEPSSNGS